MTATTKTAKSADCAEGLRNRFFSRKRMQAEDFKIEQNHMIGRRRHVNSAVLGSGVVYGYAIQGPVPVDCGCQESRPSESPPAVADNAPSVSATVPAADASASAPTPEAPLTVQTEPASPPTKAAAVALKVGPGFALDHCGREALLQQATELNAENTFLLVMSNNVLCAREIGDKLDPGKYLLAVHYAERATGQTVLSSFCGCGDAERTHVCETAMFSLRWLGKDTCPCAEPDCPGGEACLCDACCGRGRGPHARLVAWATERDFSCVSELRPWMDHEVAIDDPVELACVDIAAAPEKCKPVTVTSVDASSPRRIVKTNDSLYDLLSGCGLTRISAVSWAAWHRNREPMEWSEFAGYFTSTEYGADSILTNFTARFSGPVLSKTVRRDVISITVNMPEGGTGWIRSRKIPVTRLDLTPSVTTLPAGTTDQFRVAVAKRWVRDEIDQGGESYLSERDFVVEIEVRGDLIEDCSGQTVDANSVGLASSPTGNGTPGGTYFSTFKVKRMTRAADASEDNERVAQ